MTDLEKLTDEEFAALSDSEALADVPYPADLPPLPWKDYSPESHAEWAREMVELYGKEWLDENPLVDESATAFEHDKGTAQQRRTGQHVIDLLAQGVEVNDLPAMLRTTMADIEGVVFDDPEPGVLEAIAEAVYTEEETTRQELADRVNAPVARVGQIVDAIGPLPDSLFAEPRRTQYTAQDKRDMLVLHDAGYTPKQLSEWFKVNIDTLYAMLRREGRGK